MCIPRFMNSKFASITMLAALLVACGGGSGESKDAARGDAPTGSSTSAAASGPEAYEAVTQQGRIRLEILNESQARMMMYPSDPYADAMPEQMSFDVRYERVGDAMIVALPGDDPMQLMRDGRDFVATMDGETARFIRQ